MEAMDNPIKLALSFSNMKTAITTPTIAPGISFESKATSHLRQKLLILIASAMIRIGNIRATACVAGISSINRGTANIPKAPANADLEIPVSKTTKEISTIVENSTLISLKCFKLG